MFNCYGMYAIAISVTLIFCSCLTVAAPGPFKEECVSNTYPPKGRPVVPSYIINLDQPPATRWNQLAKDQGRGIKNLLDNIINLVKSFGSFSQKIIDFVNNDVGKLADTLPAPYGDEIKGLANATGLPLGQMVLYNLFYEIFTVCTSIIAEDPTGKLFHARNLDFGLFLGWDPKNHSWLVTQALRPLIVNLDFQQGGKTVFKAVNFAGYVGILTAVKPGVLTLSMNERFNLDGGFLGILEWILGRREIQWVGFLTRDTLQYAKSYTQAKDKLANTPMLAPAYFILGGNKSGQGCVITRSRDKAVDIWEMSTPKNKSWFILETNYDHWLPTFFLDDRRTPGNQCMQKLGQKGVSVAGIFDVLSSRPVLNLLTTYTAIMQVNEGHLETWIQFCPQPCPPW